MQKDLLKSISSKNMVVQSRAQPFSSQLSEIKDGPIVGQEYELNDSEMNENIFEENSPQIMKNPHKQNYLLSEQVESSNVKQENSLFPQKEHIVFPV